MSTANPNLKIIDFLGKPVYYVATAEGNFVLIRPLCDALGVDADRQIRDMKADEILGDEVSEQTTHLPGDDKRRNWTCLPEEFIYGWLFSIKMANTMSDATKQNLIGYKRSCYHALYQHFHGKLLKAQTLQKEEAIIDVELQAIEQRLLEKQQEDPDFQRKQELLTKRKQIRAVQTQQQKEDRQFAFDFARAEQSAN